MAHRRRSPKMSTFWIFAYFGLGAIVYLLIRKTYKKASIATSAHSDIWFGEILGLLLWPIPAMVSLFWLLGEWSAKKEAKRFALAEAVRRRETAENPYRALSTSALLTEVDRAIEEHADEKKANTERSPNRPSQRL